MANRDSKAGEYPLPMVSWLAIGFVGSKGIWTNNMTKGGWFYMPCVCVCVCIYIYRHCL